MKETHFPILKTRPHKLQKPENTYPSTMMAGSNTARVYCGGLPHSVEDSFNTQQVASSSSEVNKLQLRFLT